MASESLAPAVLRRINKETNALRLDPPEGVRVVLNEEDIADVKAWVAGPPGTPYEGGFFKVRFSFGGEFPAAPPKCTFITKLFHPNVGPSGEICVNTLKKDWSASHTLSHILVVIKCLLIYPNPESALDEEAGRLLLERYEEYAARARLVTKVHGNVGRRPVEFEVESKSEREARLAAAKVASTSSSACCDPSVSQSPVIAVNPLQPSSTSNVPSSTFTDVPLSSVPMSGVLSSGGSSTSSTLSKKRSVGTALGASATTAGGNAGISAAGTTTAGVATAKKGAENVAGKKVVAAAAGQAKKRGLKRL